MPNESTDDPTPYLKTALISSTDPSNDLRGTLFTLRQSHEVSYNDDEFEAIISEARERYDASEYIRKLIFATIYIEEETEEVVGIDWYDDPRVYDEDEFSMRTDELPDSIESLKTTNHFDRDRG